MATEITIELDGETEHQFEYLLENVEMQDANGVREVDEEELATELLRSAVMDNYIQAIGDGR